MRDTVDPTDKEPTGETLRQVSPRPVFIIGLHRSGTTFLYQLLSHALNVAILTIYHVVHYDRILRHRQEGTEASAKGEIDQLFQNWHMESRLGDNISLSQAMPEEYGWLLRRWAGAFCTNARTAPLLDEICRKLQFLMPSAEAVLLKNPWDAGHVGDVLNRFPDARFIFLQRTPVAIVNSQFRIAQYFSKHKDPFIHLLFNGIPLGRAWLWTQRAVRKVVGEKWHGRIALGYIKRDVVRELKRLETSWKLCPPDQKIALDYNGLIDNPQEALQKVSGFLGISPRPEFAPAKSNPRIPALLPEVERVEADFCRLLASRRIAQQPFGEQ